MPRVVLSISLVLLVLGIGGIDAPARTNSPTPELGTRSTDTTTSHVTPGYTGYSPQSMQPPLTKSWTRSLTGTIGYPLVGSGHVFLVEQTDPDEYFLRALRTRNGRTAWSAPLAGSPSYTTALDGNALYVLSSSGFLSRYSAATGARRWRRDLRTEQAWTFHDEPTAAGGWVYVAGGGIESTVIGIDGTRGRVRWRASAHGSGTVPAVSGGKVFVSYPGPQLYAFDAHTGRRMWHDGAFPHGGGAASSTVYRGRVYAQFGTGLVLDTDTGRLQDAFYSSTPPAVHGDTIVFNEAGRLHAVRRDDHAHLWFSPAGIELGVPIIVDDEVYASASDGLVHAFSLATGREVWRTSAYGPLAEGSAGVTPGGGLLLVSGRTFSGGSYLVAYVD